MITNGKDHFFDFDHKTYLNCANHGPLPRVTAEAIQEALALKTHPNRIPDHIYFTLTGRIREGIGAILKTDPNLVTLGTGESHGAAVAALGLGLRAGDEVVLAKNDFPSNIYIWSTAARDAGGRVRMLTPDGPAMKTEQILDAINENTRAVSVSLVDFGSGQVLDVPRIAKACKAQDIFLCVDATQAVGIIPMSFDSLGASMITAAGYKWMLAPYGCGFAVFDKDWMDRIKPKYITWTAAEGAEQFNSLPRENWNWHPTARRFDAPEAASFLNMSGLARSIDFILEHSVEAMHDHVRELLNDAESKLPSPFRRRDIPSFVEGPILSIESEDVSRIEPAYLRLREKGIVVSLREDGIRVSPHIFNTTDDMDRLVQELT